MLEGAAVGLKRAGILQALHGGVPPPLTGVLRHNLQFVSQAPVPPEPLLEALHGREGGHCPAVAHAA